MQKPILVDENGKVTAVSKGSAKIIMRTLAIRVRIASRFNRLADSSQADFLLPFARRWL